MIRDDAHCLDTIVVAKKLKTDLNQGLTVDEAKRRLEDIGPNALPEEKRRGLAELFLDQFKDFLIILLIAAAAVSGALGEYVDAAAIVVIITINAVIGLVQEYKAEKAIEALKSLAAAHALVKRDGAVIEIPTSELVPGDLVLLDAGRIVPADLRLIEGTMLKVQEAALTGESIPVDKRPDKVFASNAPIGDRQNMVFKGTQVVLGRGLGIVVATGAATELGRIAGLIAEQKDTKTPLQKRLSAFGRQLGLIALAICAIVFVIGLLRGEDLLLMFLTSVSLAVAAVPEALPALAAIALALGAKRMVQINALVRRLPAVETLGSVTAICTDKTGTLTENSMRCERFWTVQTSDALEALPISAVEEDIAWRWLAVAMALCNDASLVRNSIMGDPTETALLAALDETGLDHEAIRKTYERMAEIPFDSSRRLMTTVHTMPHGGLVSFTKGAVESVLACSSAALVKNGKTALDSKLILTKAEQISESGLRVLAFAMKHHDAVPANLSIVENELVFLGLVGLMDPPRPEAFDAIRQCKKAGITPIMITGDHPATALAIARRLGIAQDRREVMTGDELSELTLDRYETMAKEIKVYARVSPEQKLKIVMALQDRGEFVAMTGDGVNDAPALKKADIGVAMGVTGTDVAKEAADMILLDDNFATIVKAVHEGRRIYDNIRKFIKYILASNSGEIWTIFLAPFLGLPIPLLPIHILWINLVTDGLPGLALAVEPGEKDVMERPPRPPKEGILAQGLGIHAVWVGLLMAFVCLCLQAASIYLSDMHWQTMVFTVLCLSQMGHVLAIRSEWQSLFSQGLCSNLSLAGAVTLTIVLQLATVYVPLLQSVFKTQALGPWELIICLAASSLVFWAVEAEKMLKRRKRCI
ncbi:cation-translocating P-type ATPase [Dissulfurimicrobium hydrothermale]|uniref:cation-translocating P-type ATPase n=1 Tax=Dissulfurimicrobium hydrothermale TaxID=1750598 RepID=UPI001EDC5E53|nr:cation-translocating P-type ATPase [Dissulfurimicrobium hydrothermale]UKL13443.1 cation-translocating P-type ATPase [Dissulfurimicrobium hydrothermale]